MINGNTQKLIWWVLGALLTITMSLSIALFSTVTADINRIEQRQTRIEFKIEQIQLEYYRIAVIESQLAELLSR